MSAWARVGAKAGRVAEVVRKELLQLRRDPRLRRLILVAPMIQLLVFGYAVSTDVRHTATFLVDQDRSPLARELADAFTASGYFDVVARSEAATDAVEALDRGEATVGLVIPPGFGRDLLAAGADGAPAATVQLLVDGTNSNIATVALGYAEGILRSFGARVAAAGAELPEAAVALQERAWYNPSLESRNYNVPAVVGTLMLLVALLLTALAIVREREIGTLEQLMVSPLTPGELIAGKTLPFALIAFVDLGLVTTIAVLWFEVPFRGNLLVLLLASLLFLLPALGTGLLISTVSSTQQEAFLTTFLTFMPTILLSGFLFPISSMPKVFQWLTLVNPLRHYLEIVRGVFLKGTGLAVLWPQHLALLALGAALLTLATRRFEKRVQ
ncbi:MAG TPA: ABC transporter permease [Thermoanaerobaculia bacterium]|nr:ABC transporter permease [Thermoanaerobaculia bacterium]